MKKIINRIAIILFILGSCGILCGFAATGRIRPYLRRVAIEAAVNNNIIKFFDDKLSFLDVDTDGVRDIVNDISFIENVVDIYVDASIKAMAHSLFSRTDVKPYLDKSSVNKELAGVISNVIYSVMEFIDVELDTSSRFMLNGIITLGSSGITDMISREVNEVLNKDMDFSTKLETRLYLIMENRIIFAVLITATAAAFAAACVTCVRGRHMTMIGICISAAGAVSLLVLLYNTLKSSYKVKKIIGFSIDIGFGNYMVASGIICAVGLVIIMFRKIFRQHPSQ